MNRTFRKVWSRARGTVVVASELAKRRGAGARATQTNRGVGIGLLALALAATGSVYAQAPAVAQKPDATSAESISKILAKSLEDSETNHADAAAEAARLAPWVDDTLLPPHVPAMSLAGISPMSIIEPPPATGGTLPGLVQYLNNWLLGNDYQACTALTSDCLTIPRANFDYSRSEEHTSELQSLMRISYAVFCLKKKTKPT